MGTKRAKVAILTNYPVDHQTFTGGVETATAALLEGLKAYQEQYDFHLVSIARGSAGDVHQQQDGFWFHFLSTPRHPLVRPRLPFRIFKAYRQLRLLRPDLVHCQDNMALAIATIWSGYQRLFTIHGVKRHEARKRTGWERWSAVADSWLEPYVYRQFDDFVCISHYSKNVLSSDKRTYFIPNAVRAEFFQIERQDAGHPIVLFVGGLSPLKGPEDLLSAHHRLRQQYSDLETVLCGTPETAAYQRRLDALAGEGIRFAGLTSLSGLKYWLSRCTVLLLPSRQENAPIVIAEAMAAGVPVIATSVGGVPDMVEDGQTGLLYDVGDVQGLIACLEGVLTFPEQLEEMAQNGREKAWGCYHPDRVAEHTINVYDTLLKSQVVAHV